MESTTPALIPAASASCSYCDELALVFCIKCGDPVCPFHTSRIDSLFCAECGPTPKNGVHFRIERKRRSTKVELIRSAEWEGIELRIRQMTDDELRRYIASRQQQLAELEDRRAYLLITKAHAQNEADRRARLARLKARLLEEAARRPSVVDTVAEELGVSDETAKAVLELLRQYVAGKLNKRR
jgi:hypothetical protein